MGEVECQNYDSLVFLGIQFSWKKWNRVKKKWDKEVLSVKSGTVPPKWGQLTLKEMPLELTAR